MDIIVSALRTNPARYIAGFVLLLGGSAATIMLLLLLYWSHAESTVNWSYFVPSFTLTLSLCVAGVLLLRSALNQARHLSG